MKWVNEIQRLSVHGFAEYKTQGLHGPFPFAVPGAGLRSPGWGWSSLSCSVVSGTGLMPLLEQVFMQPREVCDTLTWQGAFPPQRQLSCPWEPLSRSSPAVVQYKQHFLAKSRALGLSAGAGWQPGKPLTFCCPAMPARGTQGTADQSG